MTDTEGVWSFRLSTWQDKAVSSKAERPGNSMLFRLQHRLGKARSRRPGSPPSREALDLDGYYRILQKLVLQLSQTWRFKSVTQVSNAGGSMPAIFKVK